MGIAKEYTFMDHGCNLFLMVGVKFGKH